MEYKEKKSFRKGLVIGILVPTVIFTIILILILAIVYRSSNLLSPKTKAKIEKINELLNEHYYQGIDVSDEQEGLYKGLVEGVGDKYTVYYSAEEAEKIKTTVSGSFSGLGAILAQDKNTKVVTVSKVYDGSAAQAIGLVKDDIIVAADGKQATNYDLSEFVSYTKGDEGTTFELTYIHNGEQKTATVTRTKVVIPSVDHKMLEGNIGYIEIDEFTDNTYQEYMTAINDLKAQGAVGVIFDLRVNGGGVVQVATAILDEILPKANIVSIIDKNGNKQEYNSDEEKKLDLPIVVLTSGNTASAAEIFAGAIKDNNAGTLVGTKTYGKGVVQGVYDLKDGSILNITIATYYTPSGACIHEKGIEPNEELEFDYSGDVNADYNAEYDNQVKRAKEIILSK